jgi:uncharacterized protein YdaU (DUF1376 family)
MPEGMPVICRCGANPDGLCGECWLEVPADLEKSAPKAAPVFQMNIWNSGEVDDTISPSDQGLTLPVSKLETMQGNSEHSLKLPPVAVIKPSPVMPCAAFRPGGSFRGCSMNYFQFHIGDYASHTRHLTNMEDLAYRRMLDEYYLKERPLSGDVQSIARQINLREYESEVAAVLNEFFQQTDDGWANARADQEIAHFQQKREKASNAGKVSIQRKLNGRSTDVQRTLSGRSTDVQQTLNVCSTNVQPTSNQEPITINHKPITKGAFQPPTVEQVEVEMMGRTQDPKHEAIKFVAFYESNGWKVGKNPMKSWKAGVTNWVSRTKQPQLVDMSQTAVVARLTDTSWAD